jgi:hypothetical protein
MGMFDWYRPLPPLNCPACGQLVDELWQGKDGPNGLFLWEQGSSTPVNQLVDDECKSSVESRLTMRLPESFVIYADQCGCDRFVFAFGYCKDGVWQQTEIETHQTARPGACESDREFAKRVAALQKWIERP